MSGTSTVARRYSRLLTIRMAATGTVRSVLHYRSTGNAIHWRLFSLTKAAFISTAAILTCACLTAIRAVLTAG